MTSSEFWEYYARNSGVTVEGLRDQGKVVVRCNCGEKECQGWAMVAKDIAEDPFQQELHGYRYPEPGE